MRSPRIRSEGIQLLNCNGIQSAANWVQTGSTGTFSINDEPDLGIDDNNAVRIQLTNSGAGIFARWYLYFPTPIDCSDSDLWTMSVLYDTFPPYWQGASSASIELLLSSDAVAGTFTNYKLLTGLNGAVTGVPRLGRNVFSWSNSEWGGTGGTINYASIQNMRLRVFSNGTPHNMVVQGLWNGRKALPTVAITFDDGNAEIVAAAAIANPLRIPLTCYIIPNLLGASVNYATEEQVAALAANGNAICGHSASTLNDQVDFGYAMMAADIDWIRSHGYHWQHYAYPGGAVNPGVLANALSLKLKTGRVIRGYGYEAGPPERYGTIVSYEGNVPTVDGLPDWYQLNASPLNNTQSLAQCKTAIDTAIRKGENIVFYGHRLGVANSVTWTTADFTALMEYIAQKQYAGLIDAVTMPEMYDTYRGINVRPQANNRAAST